MDHLFCGSFMLFLSSFCYAFVCVCFADALWSPAWKGLTSWLSFVTSNCEVVTFTIGILGQMWCLIVSIPDLCPLSYFSLKREMNFLCIFHRSNVLNHFMRTVILIEIQFFLHVFKEFKKLEKQLLKYACFQCIMNI